MLILCFTIKLQMPNYVVLSRKYRPKILDDLVGQRILVQSIKSAIEQDKIPHAFLFCGIRGTGKTTVARILARCLNCIHGPTINPCGICDSCKAMDSDQHLDVIEFDAASRTGIDDIREVIDSCQYVPVNGKYKIFIVDEIHMLSKSAFNALLKTLEEPPVHVKFIFATTEKHKVPDTIMSRCIVFQLHNISQEIIANHIKNICSKENVVIDDDASKIIAQEASGSMRDAISMLEQSMMLAGDRQINGTIVSKMLGGALESDTISLLQVTLLGQADRAIAFLQYLIQNGSDPFMIFKDLQNALYKMIVDKVNGNNKEYKEINLQTLLYAWQIFLNQSKYFGYSADVYQILVCTLVIVAKTALFQDDREMCDDLEDEDVTQNLSEAQKQLVQKVSDIIGQRICISENSNSSYTMLEEIKKNFGKVQINEVV